MLGELSMNDKIIQDKLLKIFNKSIYLEDRYVTDEITVAFSKESYSSGSEREQQLYIIFFTEFNNNEDVKDFTKFFKTTSRKINSLYKSFSEEKKKEFSVYWSARVTRKKLSYGKIKSRETYKYIEKFEIYELTPCISYEMAIRNKDVQSLLEKYKKINTMMEEDRYLYKMYFTENNFKDVKNRSLLIVSEEYEDCTYEEYEAIITKKLTKYKRLIDKDYKKFIDDYIYRCTELGISELNLLKKKLENELINDYLIYPTGYRRDVPGATYLYNKEEIRNSKKDKKKTVIDENVGDGIQIRFEEIIHDEFIQVQGVNIKKTEYYVNNIIPNFNRQVNDQNQINIPINFSLPLEEIIEYITIVKKKINPKTPLELLGEKLQKSNNLSNLKTEKETLDATRGEEPQIKFADMFFIYDMKQNNFTNEDIINELNFYSDDRNTGVSTNTIKKYFNIAKNYIENKRYEELITGKSKINDNMTKV